MALAVRRPVLAAGCRHPRKVLARIRRHRHDVVGVPEQAAELHVVLASAQHQRGERMPQVIFSRRKPHRLHRAQRRYCSVSKSQGCVQSRRATARSPFRRGPPGSRRGHSGAFGSLAVGCVASTQQVSPLAKAVAARCACVTQFEHIRGWPNQAALQYRIPGATAYTGALGWLPAPGQLPGTRVRRWCKAPGRCGCLPDNHQYHIRISGHPRVSRRAKRNVLSSSPICG